MTNPETSSDLPKRLREEADYLEAQNHPPLSTRASLREAATTIERLTAETSSSVDHQQRIGAPMTFYAHECDQWWRAEATRDDASTKDCMFEALRHLDELLAGAHP